jgi:hypothetical protein
MANRYLLTTRKERKDEQEGKWIAADYPASEDPVSAARSCLHCYPSNSPSLAKIINQGWPDDTD